MTITGDPIYQEFMSRNIKPATYKRYTIILTKYVETTGLSLTDLINEAEEDEDNGIRLRKRRIKSHLDNHIKQLILWDYSPKNIRLNISILRVFYGYFEIQLPKLNLPRIDDDKSVDDIPGPREIRMAWSHANPMYQAIILLMASSGMSIAEALSIKTHHLLEASKLPTTDVGELNNIPPKMILWWSIKRIKTNHPYYTFSSPETTTHILEYLHQHPPLTVDDQLFRIHEKNKPDRPLLPHNIQQYFNTLNDKCGFGLRGRQRYFKAHNLRKFFSTTCEKHIPHMATRHMLGHKFGGVEGAYFLKDQQALYNEYKKVVEYLSIIEPLTVVDTDEVVQEQRTEIDKLKKQQEEDRELMLHMKKYIDDLQKKG